MKKGTARNGNELAADCSLWINIIKGRSKAHIPKTEAMIRLTAIGTPIRRSRINNPIMIMTMVS
jgi:hypothetical protein